MPTHRWVRPVLIIVGIVSVIFIALIIIGIVSSTTKMDWDGTPAASVGSAVMRRQGVTSVSAPEMAVGGYAADTVAVMPAPMPPTKNNSGATADERAAVGPKIIKNGSVRLSVRDTDKTVEQINGIAKEKGGFVADVRVSENDGEKTGYITIRIPVAKFDETATAVKKLAVMVLDESANSEDVTAQYVDLQARLNAKKAEEAQYLEILKRAVKIEDILQVTQYLSNVRTEIEQLQGQLRYLSDKTDYATLSITLVQETRVQAPTPSWQPAETFRQALQYLIVVLQGFVNVAIVVVIFAVGFILPLLLVLALIVWLIRVAIRRLFHKR